MANSLRRIIGGSIEGGLSLLMLLIALFSTPVAAREEPPPKPEEAVQITANLVSYDRAANQVVAEGRVVIVRGTMKLTADRVSYNPATQEAEAIGNVVLTRDEDVLSSSRIKFNLDRQTGFVEEGRLFVKKDNYDLQGRVIEKLGPQTYMIKDATFTTCKCGLAPPSWKITTEEAKVTLGGFGKLRKATFYVRDIPVFYLPWVIFPVVVERSTGFLAPTPGFSNREGPKLKIPFFWAISRSSDATFELDYRGRRGPKVGGEYRYVLSKDARGKFAADFLDDRLDNSSKYTIAFDHDQIFDPRFFVRVEGKLLGDESQLAEFEEDIERRSARQLKSIALLTKDWDDFSFIAELNFFQDLVRGKESTVPQVVPRVSLVGVPQYIFGAPFFYRFDSQVANFIRGAGESGTRAFLNPQLGLPFKLGGVVDFTPQVGLREVFYQLEGGRSFSSGAVTFVAPFSLEMEKVYSLQSLGPYRLRHSLEPSVAYEEVARVRQARAPFFDPVDRFQQGRALTLSLNSRFFLKNDETGAISQVGRVRLAWLKDLSKVEFDLPERPFPDLLFEMELTAPKNLALDIDSEFNPSTGTMRSFNAELSLGGGLLSFRYRYTRGQIDEIDATTKFTLFNRLTLDYLVSYSLRENVFLESKYGVTYLSACRCWSLRVVTTDRVRPNRTDVSVQLILAGLGGAIP